MQSALAPQIGACLVRAACPACATKRNVNRPYDILQPVAGMESLQPNPLDVSRDSESDGFDVVVGGEGGSGAWVGKVRRRKREKSVMRVDHDDDGALRSYRCSALDDKIELL